MKIVESWLREWINPSLAIKQIADQLTTAGLEVAAVHSVAADFNGVVVGEVIEVTPHPDAERLRLCQVNVGSAAVAAAAAQSPQSAQPSPSQSLPQPQSSPSPLSIVCGASNVRCGLKVPVALIGANLPGNVKIKKSKLRGVESYGMLCSAKELQLNPAGAELPGLMELPSDAPVGMDVRQYLKLDDNVVEIELTANRGDCLSVLGVARELAALNNVDAASLPKLAEIKALLKSTRQSVQLAQSAAALSVASSGSDVGSLPHSAITITLTVPDACSNYAACIMRGINNRVLTPAWIKERLEKSGLRSVNPVVDVTNYVMLELGQPLHAFAYDKVAGDVVVRYAQGDDADGARSGACAAVHSGDMTTALEKIVLLDGKELALDRRETLVIADRQKVLAIAGVMGGLDTAVDENTTTILLESAYFAPENIRQTARHYNLQTDAAYRFERGVDPALQELALARARQLLCEVVGGNATPIVKVSAANHVPPVKIITLQFAMLNRILGAVLAPQLVINILRLLGMLVQEIKTNESNNALVNDASVNVGANAVLNGAALSNGVVVTVPSYRFDLNIAEDLVEEIARIYGYDKLPVLPINAALTVRSKEKCRTVGEREIKNLLAARGYCEVITYSFVAPKLQALLDPNCAPLTLVNPISPEHAAMRTSLWPGLINVLLHNLKRKQTRMRLFETGLCFRNVGDSAQQEAKKAANLQQKPMVAGLITGAFLPLQWDAAGVASISGATGAAGAASAAGAAANRIFDFYDIKSDVEYLLNALHCVDVRANAKPGAAAITFRTTTTLLHPALHPKRCAAVYLGEKMLGYVGELHPQVRQELEIKQSAYLFELDIKSLPPKEILQFVPISKFPAMERDIAFVVDKEVPWQSIKEQVQTSGGELLHSVKVFDIYQGEGIEKTKKSVALRLRFQHLSRTLTDVEIDNAVQKIVPTLEQKLKAVLRG